MPSLATRRRQTSPQSRDPFRELADLQPQMGQLIDSVWSGGGADDGSWSPLVDIEDSEDAWTVEADLPGVKRDDVHVELADGELAITGEVKERKGNGARHRRMRRTGRFEYRVMLPGDTNADDVGASLKDGVLTVRIPKGEQSKRRQIQIKPAD